MRCIYTDTHVTPTLHRRFMLAENSLIKIGYSHKNTFRSITTSTLVQKGSNIGQPKPTLPQQKLKSFTKSQLSHMLATTFFLNMSQTQMMQGAGKWWLQKKKRTSLYSVTSDILAAEKMLQQPCPCSDSPTIWPLHVKMWHQTGECNLHPLLSFSSQQALAWGTREKTNEIKEL